MWTKRQRNIVEIIMRHSEGINGAAIGSMLSVSDRTVRNDIKLINKTLSICNCSISASNKVGYYFSSNAAPIIASLLENNKIVYDEADITRRRLILVGNLMFEGEISLDSLAEELYVSEQTIYKDLVKLQAMIQNDVKVDFLCINSHSVTVVDNEETVRKVFLAFMKDEMKKSCDIFSSELIYLLGSYNDTSKLKEILMVVKDVCQDKEIVLTDNSLYLLVWSVYFFTVRNHIGHRLKESYDSENTKEMIIKVKSGLVNGIVDLYPNDIDFLNNILWIMEPLDCKKNINDADEICKKVVNDFCDEVYRKYGIYLKNSQELFDNMINHINYMLRRLREGYEQDNPIKNDIREKYVLAYEIAMLIVPIVYRYEKKYLIDGEVAYISAYIEYYLGKVCKKARVVLVSRYGLSMSGLIEKWLTDNFYNQIDITAIIPIHQLKDYLSSNQTDLVISIFDIVAVKHIPVYVIEKLDNTKNRIKIAALLNQIRLGQKYEGLIRRKFNTDVIKIYNERSTFEEIIADLSNLLFQHKYINDADIFAQDVVEREVIYPTFISNWFMIPHPLMTYAKKSVVAVAILKKPLKYNDKEVKLIFLLALEGKNDLDVQDLFHLFRQIGINQSIFKNLIQSSSASEFISELLKVPLLTYYYD